MTNRPIKNIPTALYVLSALAAILIFIAGGILGRGGLLDFDSHQSNPSIGLPEDLNYESVEVIYDFLKNNYNGQFTEEQILGGLKTGLVESLGDPYSEYLNPVQAAQFYTSLEGSFSGIGAQLGKQNDDIIVISPLDGSPAEAAGLRPLDQIVAVDGEDVSNLGLTAVVALIRGEAGTQVTLTVQRDQAGKLDIEIVRAVIDVPSVSYRVEDGVGIIRVIQFSDDTTQLARQAAEEFLGLGVKKIILDLRNNPGGYLEEAVTLSNLWLEAGQPVVQVQSTKGSDQTERAGTSGLLLGIPTVVLVNQGSASASEIVAGALQDHAVATIVGQQSFGKGSVQTLETLGSQGELLKLTTARWLTPSGRDISGFGITPDIIVEVSVEDGADSHDVQLEKAKQLLL